MGGAGVARRTVPPHSGLAPNLKLPVARGLHLKLPSASWAGAVEGLERRRRDDGFRFPFPCGFLDLFPRSFGAGAGFLGLAPGGGVVGRLAGAPVGELGAEAVEGGLLAGQLALFGGVDVGEGGHKETGGESG